MPTPSGCGRRRAASECSGTGRAAPNEQHLCTANSTRPIAPKRPGRGPSRTCFLWHVTVTNANKCLKFAREAGIHLGLCTQLAAVQQHSSEQASRPGQAHPQQSTKALSDCVRARVCQQRLPGLLLLSREQPSSILLGAIVSRWLSCRARWQQYLASSRLLAALYALPLQSDSRTSRLSPPAFAKSLKAAAAEWGERAGNRPSRARAG